MATAWCLLQAGRLFLIKFPIWGWWGAKHGRWPCLLSCVDDRAIRLETFTRKSQVSAFNRHYLHYFLFGFQDLFRRNYHSFSNTFHYQITANSNQMLTFNLFFEIERKLMSKPNIFNCQTAIVLIKLQTSNCLRLCHLTRYFTRTWRQQDFNCCDRPWPPMSASSLIRLP